jgi:hypothetical protein
MAGFGLKLGRSQGMEGFTGNTNEFSISPAYTGKIYSGDVVALVSGFVEEASGNTPGAIAEPILGVFIGCRFVGADGSYEFRNQWDGGAGRSNAIAMVAMPPVMNFYAKLSAPATAAAVGTRRALTYVAGSVQYGDSRVLVGAVNAAGPVLIQRLAPFPGNDWTDAEPIVEVSIVAQQATYAVAT